MDERIYRRRLPHWQVPVHPLFVTWRLFGSPPPPAKITTGRDFVAHDQSCDRAERGPFWLKRDDIAELVADAFLYTETTLQRYRLCAWVIMPNHVHLLVDARAPLPEITKGLKAYTARQANRLLDRTGQPFWSRESFDRWIRDDAEFGRVVGYIEKNPVKAGLVSRPELWRWSSAWQRDSTPDHV